MKQASNKPHPAGYEKFPFVQVKGLEAGAWRGWPAIGAALRAALRVSTRTHNSQLATLPIVVLECYPGVLDEPLLAALTRELEPVEVIESRRALLPPPYLEALVQRDLGNDPVFGRLSLLQPEELFDPDMLSDLQRRARAGRAGRRASSSGSGMILVYGFGAALVAPQADLLIYADMARWEIQMRMRRGEIDNLGTDNRGTKWSLKYKRGFFFDWRVADRLKKRLIDRWDFVLDTNAADDPKLASGAAVREGLRQTARRPFRVVPFFDPAPWGGQWMKRVCDLDRDVPNYGWCFDCVPEENSLRLRFGEVTLELPSIDLVFHQPRHLLGDAVHARFGTEFPIRFDFLDTMDGGNLSFQVHPLTEYIQDRFGMHYTQDESYYLLDVGADAAVYLGLRGGVNPETMAHDLRAAQEDAARPFDADRYANRFPARRHDHFLIPAGTVHCSGRNAMVLEISATPYIFTFKLWDWDRLGLDGRPRPIHLDHGLPNIQWERDTDWARTNLVNRFEPLGAGPGWREERTGLHEREFIETRRHWFTAAVPHHTGGGVNVLNLVEGQAAVVESPGGAFDPFEVHYAETFIIPAAVGAYTIRPLRPGDQCATIKAYVRTR